MEDGVPVHGHPGRLLVALGLMTDLFSGLPLSLTARSWGTWLLGIIALGVLYLLAEGGGGWIDSRDKVSPPLWKRVWHLTLLLGLAVVVSLVAGAVIRAAQ
jgi:hypothetical protein